MSKKTLKRSLALGALMAFVITGSAWAETITADKTLSNGIFSHSDFSGVTGSFSSDKTWNLGSNTLMITGTNGNTVMSWCSDYAVYANNFSFVGEEGSALQISNDDGSALKGGGILTNGTIDVGNLVINVTDKAFYAAGVLDVTADTINITSTEGEAVFASDGGTLNITANEKLNIKGEEYAILVGAGAAVYVKSDDSDNPAEIVIEGDIGSHNIVDVKLATATSYIKGASTVYADSAQVNFTLDSDATWNVTGDSTVTGLAGNGGNIKGTDVKVTVNNAQADKTNVVIKDSTLNFEGVDLEVNSSYGTASYSGGVIQNTTIKSDGSVVINQTGRDNVIGNGKNTIIAKSIELNSSNASAIYCQENGDCETNLNAEEIKLTSNFGGYTAAGVYTANGAQVNITGFKKLEVYSNCDVDDEGAYGITANNSTVNIIGSEDAESTIYIESDGHSALSAIYGGNLTVTADKIEVSTEKFRNDDSAYKTGVIAVRDSSTMVINVDEELKITDQHKRTDENATNAIKVTDGSLTFNTKEDTIIDIDGNITQTAGAMTLALQNKQSVLDGAINTATEGADITFANGAAWNNTGASNVAKLTLNDGIINQNAEDKDISIASYSGSGTINYADASVGNVYIDEGSGSLKLAMKNATDLEAVANKLSVKEDAADIEAKIVEAEGAVKGETITDIVYDAADEAGYRMGTLGKTVERTNTTNASINNMLNVALMAWRAENNDMNKRLGELRNANGEHGVWVRMVNGESEYKNVENEYKTYQLGYDEKLSVDPSWTVGAAVSYTEGDSDSDRANGENKHKGFSVYGSKLNDDGSFVDLIAKVARVEHDFNIAGEKGDWDSNGYSFSAEYGKRLQQGNGLWIEPQVELTYGKISSAECELAGRTVTLEDMESLVGRVGFSLGKDIKQGNVYARASYLYDFEGETTTKFSNATDSRSFEQDLGGGWWEVGVGANINLSKATYIYADVEKTFGGEVDTNWQWNLGVRYSF